LGDEGVAARLAEYLELSGADYLEVLAQTRTLLGLRAVRRATSRVSRALRERGLLSGEEVERLVKEE
jgi:hypothetical protein